MREKNRTENNARQRLCGEPHMTNIPTRKTVDGSAID